MSEQKLVATYQYTDESGNLLYEVCRFEPGENGKSKTFKQRRVTEDGNLAWGLTEHTRRVLYMLPEVLAAQEVFLCEGEKDVHTCKAMGLTATTNSGGAGQKWVKDDGERADFVLALSGKHVIMFPDNDEAGRNRADTVGSALAGIAASFTVVELPRGKDITEFLQKEGGTTEELNQLIEVAKLSEGNAVRKVGELIRKRGNPAAVESEKLIIGSIMNGTTPFVEIGLSASDFSQDNNKTIYSVLRDLDSIGAATDIKSVIQTLQDKGLLEVVGGLSYLIDLTEDLPGAYNIDQHVEQVTKKAQTRTFLASVMKAAEGLVVGGDLDEARESVSKSIDAAAVYSANDDRMSSTADVISDLESFLAKRKPGILCKPLAVLNEMTYGLQEGNLYVIGGRPSQGKSSLAGMLCAYAAYEGHETAVISLEVDKEEFLLKTICTIAKVPFQQVRNGEINEEQKDRLIKYANKFLEMPLSVDDRSDWTILKIRNFLKQRKARGKPVRVLMLDYLQLMGSGRQDGRRDLELGQITRGLKMIAKDFGLTVILLSQLNRDGDKNNRLPQKSDLRDSGSIEADADVIVLIWQDIKENDREIDERDALLILEKQRNGPTGRIPVRFIKPYTYFCDPTMAA